MKKLIVRVDDFPGTKPAEFNNHNLENFKLFDIVLKRYVGSYTLGVIPAYTTDEHLTWFKSQSHIEVALHGRYHDERFPNEFRDHETEQDVVMDLRRLSALLGSPITYIPPHNVVDRKTVNALLTTGFKKLWGGPGSDPKILEYAEKAGLEVVCFREPLEYGRSDELLQRGSAAHITSELKSRDVHLCLHWTWEWNVGLSNLDSYLSQVIREPAVVGTAKRNRTK